MIASDFIILNNKYHESYCMYCKTHFLTNELSIKDKIHWLGGIGRVECPSCGKLVLLQEITEDQYEKLSGRGK